MNLDEMREWIKQQPAKDFNIRRARLWMFDMWRYQEEYEKIFQFIEELKAI